MKDARPCSSDTVGLEANQLLTVEEVASWLRLTPKGIYSLVEARRLPYVRVSNRLRFFAGEIQNWLRENRGPASLEKRP